MTEKRNFNELSDGEKAALRQLHEAHGVTSSGPCDLARHMTGNRKLKPSDDEAQVYIHLLRENWIVVRHRDHRETIVRYGVSDEYLELQPA
jgi:hypothetical protein